MRPKKPKKLKLRIIMVPIVIRKKVWISDSDFINAIPCLVLDNYKVKKGEINRGELTLKNIYDKSRAFISIILFAFIFESK